MLEDDITYAKYHLAEAIKAEAEALKEGEEYPDDYLRLVKWITKAEAQKARVTIEDFLGRPIQVADEYVERLKWRVETWGGKWMDATMKVVRDELGRFVRWVKEK